jgi:hypothetical protein
MRLAHRWRRDAMIIVAGILGCAEPRREPAEPPPLPLGTTHAAPAGTGVPDTIPPPLAHAPPELHQLAAAVRALGERGRLDHARVVDAIHALADALTLVSNDGSELRGEVRTVAERLESSFASAEIHTDLVRLALDDALRVMATGAPRNRWQLSDYVARLGRLADAVSVIDVDRPLVEQHLHVVAALNAVVDAMEIALGVSVASSQ